MEADSLPWIASTKFIRFPILDFPPKYETLSNTQCIQAVPTETYPSIGQDLAKLVFWSFVSGFSEHFVPQLVKKYRQGSREIVLNKNTNIIHVPALPNGRLLLEGCLK